MQPSACNTADNDPFPRLHAQQSKLIGCCLDFFVGFLIFKFFFFYFLISLSFFDCFFFLLKFLFHNLQVDFAKKAYLSICDSFGFRFSETEPTGLYTLRLYVTLCGTLCMFYVP